MSVNNEWFAEWFDSKYYHILYQNRNDKEAELFIDKLCKYLSLSKETIVFDLACGKGRHAKYFNFLGYKTFGADFSKNSIEEAKKYEKENLHFFVHDMREPYPISNIDLVCNLFTSFGYFNDFDENLKVFSNIYSSLNNDGIFVIDFMNTIKVCSSLPIIEEKELTNINFKINKYYDSGHIYKDINFIDEGKHFNFTEKVQNLSLKTFEKLLSLSKFNILQTFGSYELTPFEENKSDRLIIIAKK